MSESDQKIKEERKEERVRSDSEKIEQRKEKISNWLKNPYNLALLVVLVLAFIIGLYFFSLTKNQALWWDEAEYMAKAKSIALGAPETGWWSGRPILFSVILSAFYFLGLGELSVRFFLVLISVFSVFLVYLVGKEIFDKKIGLISAFFFSLFYLNLFYAFRVMVDIFHLVFGLFAFYLFFKSKKNPKLGWLNWLIIPLIVIGTLLRFTTFWFFVILFIYLLFTEKTFFKNKNYWISVFLGFLSLVPYMLWSYFKFKNPLYAIFIAGKGSIQAPASRLAVFLSYIKYFPSYFHIILLIFFFVGLVSFIDFIFSIKAIAEEGYNKKFFLILWILIPLVYFGFFVNHFEDRYLVMAFPALFYIVAFGFVNVYKFTAKKNKFFAIVIVGLLLIFGGFQLLKHSNIIIKNKIPSYGDIRNAGLWIKEYSKSEDIILSSSAAQNTYYSERRTYSIPDNESDFLNTIKEKKPRYLVLSRWEKSPDWAYNWPQKNNQTAKVAQVYMLNEQQPSTIIYELVY